MSVAVAAQILDVDKHTIRDWIKAGRLAGHRANRRGSAWRIPRRDIEALDQTTAGHSVSEISDWYCVTEATVRRWIRTGRVEEEGHSRRGMFRDMPLFAD